MVRKFFFTYFLNKLHLIFNGTWERLQHKSLATGALWIWTPEGLSVCFKFNFEEYLRLEELRSCLLLLLLLLLVELGDVEALVDVPGDGLDLGAQL